MGALVERWAIRQTLAIAMVVSALCSGGCGSAGNDSALDRDEDAQLRQATSALYRDGALWPTAASGVTKIPVCFRISGDYTAEEDSRQRGIVKEALLRSFQRFTRIEFTGFGTCATPVPNGALSILLTNMTDGGRSFGGAGDVPDQKIHHSGRRGYQGATTPTYGWLQLDGVSDLRAMSVVIHEVGHALSFEHEQSRPDAVGLCPDGDAVLDGVVVQGEYDDIGIMNYCTPLQSARLSLTDIRGSQSLYGTSSGGRWMNAQPALSLLGLQ